MNKYYKVVRGYNNKYISSLGYPILDELCLEYKIDEWTEPKVGKIFVFNNLSAAKLFIGYTPYYYIFECKCVNPNLPTFSYIPNLNFEPIIEARNFWSFNKKNINNSEWIPGWMIIDNTIICDAVKLIKEIE